MLSKEFFKKGLEELEIAFSNFIMTKEKANIWYKYSKDLMLANGRKKLKTA